MNRLFLTIRHGGLKARVKNVLNLKRPSWVIITLAVALATVLGVGFALNRTDENRLAEMAIVYDSNPAFFYDDMKLIWDDTVYYATPMKNTGRGREIGFATDEYSTWRIYELRGYGRDFLLAVEGENAWRVMSSHPPEMPRGQYVLENATEKQKMERLLSVTLYDDGTAMLATPPISSYFLIPPYYYDFVGDELLIFHDRDEPFARFAVIDENTIQFKSATVSLFADSGARYVTVSHNDAPPISGSLQELKPTPSSPPDMQDELPSVAPELPAKTVPSDRETNIILESQEELPGRETTVTLQSQEEAPASNAVPSSDARVSIYGVSASSEPHEPSLNDTAPSNGVSVTIEEWDGMSASALELIYEDTTSEYYLSSIRSNLIMLTFDDGQRMSLSDALSQSKINIKDLISNGLEVIIQQKGEIGRPPQ